MGHTPGQMRNRRPAFRVLLACVCASTTVALAVGTGQTVPLLLAASEDGPQGFVRVINHSEIPGEILIDAFDDTGRWYGPTVLSIGAGASVHFNSDDLERGNVAKRMSGAMGPGAGDWRLDLRSALDIEVLAYARSGDGLVNEMSSVAPRRGRFHRVPTFNPGSDRQQPSLLRLVNPGTQVAEVTIAGVDDAGESPGEPVAVSIAAGFSRTIWADELEAGGPGLDGALGDGLGQWRLTIAASNPIMVMTLLMDSVRSTNLSAAPHWGTTVLPAEGPFRDALGGGGEGPEMARIPAGTFRMGCQEGGSCRSEELPVREVAFARPFAMSTHEVTLADWEACLDGGGCGGYRPPDEGWGRDERPVIHVSWEDAQNYVSWLSRSTGVTYRLPSEAEWEYAARAGSRRAYSWGDDIGSEQANCREEDCQDGFPNTAPVGSFAANRWGLHDMHGNVFEWVQDCHDHGGSYRNAPSDGTAWEYENCSRRTLRGGSWESSARYVRVASRAGDVPETRRHGLGFRVVRDLIYGIGRGIAPLIPLGSDRGPQGFVRVINHSGREGVVNIHVFDDAGQAFGPLTLSIGPGQAKHFNSYDLEDGNREKGLLGGVGTGTSAWRLEFSTDLDIEVLSYLRTPDGFLTAMQDTAPALDDRHRIAIFNPGSNWVQESTLRLINPGERTADVVIEGVDDSGRSPGERVRVSIPPEASRSFTAQQLESGGAGLRGALGDGAGKWRLSIESDEPIMAMSLLASPTGHVTNLSAAPQRGLAPEMFERRIAADVVDDRCVACHVGGGDAGSTRLVFRPLGHPNRQVLNLRAFRDYLADVDDVPEVILAKARGVDHGGGEQLGANSRDYRTLASFLTLLIEETSGVVPFADTGVDYDGDGLTNDLDPDDDNDGVADTDDAFPGNGAEWADINGNGRGDNGEFIHVGRAPPTGLEPLEIDGDVFLEDAAIEGGQVDLTAINGTVIARARTSRQGAFSFTLSSPLVPDWFVVRASGGHVWRVSEDGQQTERVANLGIIRAYVGKHHLDAGRIKVGPWTEIAYQEVRLRFPAHDSLPDGLAADWILDGISASFPDGGTYEQLLAYGPMAPPDGTRTALRRGIVDPMLAGAASGEVADRVSAFRAQYLEDGIVSERYRSRRIAMVDGARILTALSRDVNNRVGEVRQSYIDGTGALVDARLSLLNADDSAARIRVRHPEGHGFAVTGKSAGLRALRWSGSVLNNFEDRLIRIDGDESRDALTVNLDKRVMRAISDGELLLRVDGDPPRSDQLTIIRDDPVVEWTVGDSTLRLLNDDGVHRVFRGVPARILSNDNLLVLQFFRAADRDLFGGVGGAAARSGLYLWLADAARRGRLVNVAERPWIALLAEVYAAHGRLTHVGLPMDHLEALRPSSRVHLNLRGSGAIDRIVPGNGYGLDFSFDHLLTWENVDGDVAQCPRYSDGDIARALRDRAFRKRPAGAMGDAPCQADIRLQIEQEDIVDYWQDMPLATDDSLFSLMTTCAEARYDSASRGPDPREGKYYCHRRDVERSSMSLGNLANLEHGFYWVVPRQAVVFRPRADLARVGEVAVAAAMSLELADDRGLNARDLHYDVDTERRALYPEFEVWSDGTTLVLDARASVVDPEVPEESIEYFWSYLEVDAAAWQHTASTPLQAVPLAELGLTGEATYARIRLEITGQGQSESVTKMVRVDPDTWNRGVFDGL